MWLNIPLLALFLLTTLPPCISFILPKSSVPFSSILNLDSSSSASSSQSSSSSIPPVQVPSPATSTYNATATANTNNDDNIPSPSWSRFESSEKYKRRCLILEDALANATASARKQRNRATLLEAVVRNGGGGEKGGAGADVAGGESDPREDRLRSDALMSLERRAAFLAERVSDLSREQALAKEDLKAAEEMVLRAGKGEEEAKRRLRMEGGRREEAEKDLRDLEAFLFELEGEHAKERKAWARREEELMLQVEELTVRVSELGLGFVQPQVGEDSGRLKNRVVILEGLLREAGGEAEEARRREEGRKAEERKMRTQLERIKEERRIMAEQLLKERKRNLRDRAREVQRVERLLQAQEERYKDRRRGVRRGEGVAMRVWRVVTPGGLRCRVRRVGELISARRRQRY